MPGQGPGRGKLAAHPGCRYHMIDTPAFPLRFATAKDLGLVHRMLNDAVDEAVGDSPEFAAFEKARFSPAMLAALSAANPGYVFVVHTRDQQDAGFIVSAPEQGNVVLYWSYLKPAFRKGALAARAMAEYVRFWDHKTFHKIIFFARTDKLASMAIGRYTGYQQVADLKNQFFGQDFLMFEHPLEKTMPGFAPGVSVGLRARLWWRVQRVFGLG